MLEGIVRNQDSYSFDTLQTVFIKASQSVGGAYGTQEAALVKTSMVVDSIAWASGAQVFEISNWGGGTLCSYFQPLNLVRENGVLPSWDITGGGCVSLSQEGVQVLGASTVQEHGNVKNSSQIVVVFPRPVQIHTKRYT